MGAPYDSLFQGPDRGGVLSAVLYYADEDDLPDQQMIEIHSRGGGCMRNLVYVAALLVAGPTLAQESAHYRIESAVFNAGGRPAGGVVAQSPSYLVSLDAIGDAAIGSGVTSPGFALDGGLVGSFPPPSEVKNLRFADATTLLWNPDASVGDYAIYQGTVSPFDAGYGICAQPPPTLTAPTATLTSTPAAGQALFYLVTARNRLSEESTKGFTSAGVQRTNPAPCP